MRVRIRLGLKGNPHARPAVKSTAGFLLLESFAKRGEHGQRYSDSRRGGSIGGCGGDSSDFEDEKKGSALGVL